ncbi:MAG: YraN family protein [Candidatus Saccharibacteria bacterium]|nr:YraN family protein [Candidatus Saccharibacteria bacterium]
MSSTSTGRTAEATTADYLTTIGYTLIDRNWHNRFCEIDLVARNAGTIHFIEVKYRATTATGDPADFIGPGKLHRLRRAAAAWVQAHHWSGPYQIDVVGVTGDGAVTHIGNITGS